MAFKKNVLQQQFDSKVELGNDINGNLYAEISKT